MLSTNTLLPTPNRWGEYLATLAQAQDPPKPAVIAQGLRLPVTGRGPQPSVPGSRP